MMRRALAGACLLHLLAFLAVGRVRVAPAPPPEPPLLLVDELDVEPAPLPLAAPPPAEEAEPSRVAIAERPSLPATRVEASATPIASGAPEPVAGANGTWIVDLAASPMFGGRGRGNPFIGGLDAGAGVVGASDPAPDPNAKRKDKGLANALRAQDMAKGLGPDGPVLRALEQAVHASAAPVKGNATFRAIVDAAGSVTGVRLLDCTGSPSEWQDTREKAVAALALKKIELRGGTGAELDIRVDTDLKWPSGRSATDANGALTPRDLSDIGSHPQRVVHARLTSFQPR